MESGDKKLEAFAKNVGLLVKLGLTDYSMLVHFDEYDEIIDFAIIDFLLKYDASRKWQTFKETTMQKWDYLHGTCASKGETKLFYSSTMQDPNTYGTRFFGVMYCTFFQRDVDKMDFNACLKGPIEDAKTKSTSFKMYTSMILKKHTLPKIGKKQKMRF